MKKYLQIFTLLYLSVIAACAYASGSEIRDFYNEPGINPSKSLSQHPNESINTFNGSLTLSHTDIVVPGNGGLDIKINRVYNGPMTSVPITNPYGHNWTMHFGRIAVPASTLTTQQAYNRMCMDYLTTDLLTSKDNPSVEFSDGARELLFQDKINKPGQTTTFVTKSRIKSECMPGSAGMYVYTTDGTRYTMDEYETVSTDGGATYFHFFYTTRIEDTNGNWINIQYKSLGAYKVIDAITTSDQRSVSYDYINNKLSSINVKQSASNGGGILQTWQYVYDQMPGSIAGSINILKKVIRPDGSEWEYDYDLSFSKSPYPLLNKLTYPWGGTIDYTYNLVSFDIYDPIATKPAITKKW